jgi:hypothetical protein
MSNEIDLSNDPIAKAFGIEFAREFYANVPKPKELPIPEATLNEIKQYVYTHLNELIANKGRLKWQDKYDICLVTTPSTESAVRIRKLQTGAVSYAFLFNGSPNGWIGCIFQDPSLIDDLELNTAYIVVGKYTENEVDGVMLPKMRARAIFKATPSKPQRQLQQSYRETAELIGDID